MGLPDRQALVARLCPPLDPTVVGQLVEQFVEMERRYIQRDWKPAELDGGMFCEALARCLYHHDSGNLSPDREFGACLKYLENDQVPHAIQPRSDALHLARILRSIYKFRSDRGVAHLSSTYDANHMDSRLIAETVRWAMNEALRIFAANGRDEQEREEIARTVRELLRFEVPCIAKYGHTLLIQRTDLTAEEEVLVLLHYGGEEGVQRREISRTLSFYGPSTISGVLTKLRGLRQAVALPGERWCLTDLGAKRVREQLADRLLAM
ncbi:hypothetical protein [Anaeromyxobacter dehalogenans]|uniref:Uncharacterized protein n=1 Tax=Anaeromyxobacter dehalogenans (strain 2CP-C) TaxID=290397 RepID=Q2IHW3_ANADE|nr:hypothetical protein [Anaeromyxobacter dehalogenans]ABC81243.1 hypothetical protein Adeh_1470 [Anaeromyxobacter dehalogenans 2CP-C]